MSLARVRALIFLGVLILMAAGVVTWTITHDDQNNAGAVGRQCTKGEVRADTSVPKEQNVQLDVYNSTDRTGLAVDTATKLEGYKFHVLKKSNLSVVVHGSAEIRFGPKTVGGAQLVLAYVPGAQKVFDINRDSATVDLVLGDEFNGLRTPTDVKEALIGLGEPDPPAGTC